MESTDTKQALRSPRLRDSWSKQDKDVEMSQEGASGTPAVQIRVRNESPVDFEHVTVRFPQTEEAADFGAVPRGESSGFHTTAVAYRYASVQVKAGERELAFQPIDYVGEQELDAGRYTYVLGVDNGVLTIELERDSETRAQ